MSRRYAQCIGVFPEGRCNAMVDTFAHPELGFEIFSRGNRKAYFCPECARRVWPYSTKNKNREGTSAKEPWTVSSETETNAPTLKAKAELAVNGFLPTADCTVDVEFKSPIWANFKSIVHYAKTLERLEREGELSLNNSDCGMHTHIGNETMINPETMENFFRKPFYYMAFFKPLADALAEDQWKCERVFGRGFEHYAAYPDFESPTEHSNFINVQHPFTLEFRILRFVNAEQYGGAVMLCKKFCEVLKTRFFDHVNQPGVSSRDLEKYAFKTGEAIARIYREYNA